MADDLLGGVLGGEEERSEAEAPRAVAGAEAFAASIAAIASRQDPQVARDTSAFLQEQTRLLATQRLHLEDEHALRLAQLAHQRSLLHGQRIGQAIRIAFQVVIALVVILIGIGIAVMLHDAFTSHSVVIDAFDAPAALAARGVTGTVVASDVLDELTRLQDATQTHFTGLKRSLSNAWSSQAKVDVPETGISLGEISRLLKARFGHDLHIGGELVETASGGLALTVRGDSVVPRTFTGSADEYHQAVVDAAQYLYARFQPYLWAVYLGQSGRCPDSIAFIKSVYASVDDPQRALLLDAWAICRMYTDPSAYSMREALQQAREAIKLRPDLGQPYFIEEMALDRLGEEEGDWRVAEASRIPTSSSLQVTWDLPAELEGLSGSGQGLSPAEVEFQTAVLEVQLHDPSAAALTLQAWPANDQSPTASADAHYARALLAEETDDVSQAATEMEAFGEALANPAVAASFDLPPSARCWIAPVEEAAGHLDRADAATRDRAAEATRLGGHFVDCERFRGDILDHRGDWAGAKQAYARAVALAPDLPAGYYSWGVALARHGDLAGAIAKLQAANQRGPHWADPLKAWGDVLAKRGRWREALAKYDEALKHAPNWAALKQARAAAAARTST